MVALWKVRVRDMNAFRTGKTLDLFCHIEAPQQFLHFDFQGLGVDVGVRWGHKANIQFKGNAHRVAFVWRQDDDLRAMVMLIRIRQWRVQEYNDAGKDRESA